MLYGACVYLFVFISKGNRQNFGLKQPERDRTVLLYIVLDIVINCLCVII
jgi:hypothetical protein